MKIPRNEIAIILCTLSLFFTPVAGITTGNSTSGVQPPGPVQTQLQTFIPTTAVPTFISPVDVQQNIGIVPIWLIIGIILIIIALSGLLWRYFHPKYVPPEEQQE